MLSTNESALNAGTGAAKAELVELNSSAVSPVVANVLKEVNENSQGILFNCMVKIIIDSGELELNLNKRQKLTCARFGLKASKLLSTF